MLEPKGKPELELDLVLPEKDWPEQKLAPGQVNMLGLRLEFSPGTCEEAGPTIEGDQVPEMGTGMELRLNLESRLTLMEKPQLVPKKEVQGLLRQQVPVLESH